jgi:hypothetical protein
VRDLGQSDLCKNLGKISSLPCPFNFLPIPDPGVNKTSNPGTATLVNETRYLQLLGFLPIKQVSVFKKRENRKEFS